MSLLKYAEADTDSTDDVTDSAYRDDKVNGVFRGDSVAFISLFYSSSECVNMKMTYKRVVSSEILWSLVKTRTHTQPAIPL